MVTDRRGLGQWGEDQARRHLLARGCRTVAANWRCSAGEVDLIVLDGDCLVFVEVRTRRGRAYGTPQESITPKKLARMAEVAQSYVYEHDWDGPWRLDAIAIEVTPGASPHVEWYRNVSI